MDRIFCTSTETASRKLTSIGDLNCLFHDKATSVFIFEVVPLGLSVQY